MKTVRIIKIDHVQLAMSRGGEEEAELEEHFHVYIHDPFGNRLELLEPR